MQFVIEEACTRVDLEAVRNLEDTVFRIEKRLNLPTLAAAPESGTMRLIARTASNGEPAGTVSVVESKAHCPLFRPYVALIANGNGRVARYTRLAVQQKYRGYGLSIRMILEAQRRFVVPEKIQRTWLLFDAARASTSLLATLLAFDCNSKVIRSEYGPCRVLFRDELSLAAHIGNRRGWAFLSALMALNSVAEVTSLSSHLLGASGVPQATSLPPAA